MADDHDPPDLATIGAAVDWPDHAAAAEARDQLAAARGRYGRLEDLAEWLAGAQGAAHPKDLTRPRIVAFAAAAEPDSGLAGLLAVDRRDVVTPQPDEFSAADVRLAVTRGAAIADEEVDSGADLLIVVVPGPEVAPVAMISVLTDTEPVKVLSRGADATDPAAWMQRAIAVRDARRRGTAFRADPAGLLLAIGTTGIAAAAGFILQASARRTPIVLDGIGAAAAALVAYEAQPRAVRWWRVADSTPGPAHQLATTRIGLLPVLNLGLGLRDGTAGALAVPLLQAAARALGQPSSPPSATDAATGAPTAPEVPADDPEPAGEATREALPEW